MGGWLLRTLTSFPFTMRESGSAFMSQCLGDMAGMGGDKGEQDEGALGGAKR